MPLSYQISNKDGTNKFDAGETTDLSIKIKNTDQNKIYIKSFKIALPIGKESDKLFDNFDLSKITINYDQNQQHIFSVKAIDSNNIEIQANSDTSLLLADKGFTLKFPNIKINDELGVCKITIEATQEVDDEDDQNKMTETETKDLYCIKYYKAARDITEWKVDTHHINVDPGDSTLIRVYKIERNVNSIIDESINPPTVTENDNKPSIKTLEKSVVIDFGESNRKGYGRVVPYLQNHLKENGQIRPIDVLVVTHYDSDHVGGFIGPNSCNIIKQLDEENNNKNGTTIAKFFKTGNEHTYLYDCGNYRVKNYQCTYPSRKFEYKDLDITIERLTREDNGGSNHLLGFELFWGSADTYKQHKPIISGNIEDLRNAMDDKDKSKPALFCIAVNEEVIKAKTTIIPAIVPGSDTPTNSRSIALILVSPDNQILHYFGGDIVPPNDDPTNKPENKIADWVEAQGYTFDNTDKYVPVMKLSHHGAQASTPPELFKVFRPKYAIVSAGSKHLHPDLSLILYLNIFNKFNHNKFNKQYKIIMMGTNAPYYMCAAKMNDVKKRLNDTNKLEKKTNFECLLEALDDKILNISDNQYDKSTGNIILSEKLLKLDNASFLIKILKIWNLSNTPNILIKKQNPVELDETEFPPKYKYPHNQSIIAEFDIPRNGIVKIADVKPQPYKHPLALNPYPTSNKSGPRVGKGKKRRRFLSVNYNESFSPYTTDKDNVLIIASNGVDHGDICLDVNCEFNQFVSLLPSGTLSISNIEKKNNNNLIQITGLITGDLLTWFNEFYINNIKITLVAIKDVKEKQIINNIQVFFNAEIDQTIFSLSKPLKFDGRISPNNLLIFSLADNKIETNLFDNAKYIGYEESLDQNIIAKVLSNIFNIQANFILDNETSIFYDPLNLSNISLKWVSQVKNVKADILSNKLSLDNFKVVFCSNNHAMNDECIFQDVETYFNAKLTVDKKFSTDICATIYNDGKGNFAFEPQKTSSDNAKALLEDLCNSLLPEFKDATSLIDKMPFGFSLIKQINVNFDLSSKLHKITSVQFISSITLNDLKNLNVEFDVSITLPSTFIIAELKVNDIDNEKLMSNISLSSLFDNYGIKAPDVSSKDNIGTFFLANVYFTATPQTSSYDFYADLLNSQDSIWKISINNQEISLTEIGLSLSKIAKDISASLWSKMTLGSTKVDILGSYSKTSDKPDWLFSADISYINLNDIIYLFEDAASLPENFPSFEMSDISLNLNYTNKNFEFDFKGNCIIDAATFSISASSSDKNKKINASWDGDIKSGFNLNSIIKSLQIDLPIPDLEMNFTEASFSYDIVKKIIIFELKVNEISAYLYIFPYQNKYETLFCMDYRLYNNNSVNLPVVGITQFPVEGFQLVLATADIDLNKISFDDGNLSLPKGVINKGSHLYVLVDKSLTDKPIELSLPVQTPRNNWIALNDSFNVSSSPSVTTKWISIQKSFGAINFKRIGISYQNSKLWFLLDATLMTGIISISLEGLAVGFPLLNFKSPEFKLSGLGLDFNADALAISGSLLKDNTQKKTTYSGTISVRTPGFSLAGLGSYATLSDGSVSLFLFVRSYEPLGGPPYFYIKGLAGGFGYNQQLRMPAQDEVINFPLISGVNDPNKLGGNTDNLTTIKNLLDNQGKQWLIPIKENNWLAVGCDFTSFELINGKALLLAEFGHEFQMALVGNAQIRMPQSGYTLAYADMSLEASLKPSEGILAINALLNSSSYVLDPACHLLGGFAFYNWFKEDHAGDFVITFGGYHPSFNKPSHYPDVPRLSFNWHVSDTVNINGDAYFALTPSCVMGGGALNASYHDGDLRAWFTAYANLLMQWQPFHYDVTVGVDVGASYKLNLLFTSTTLKVELGADVQLQGPPLYGTAHVHWGVISFTVDFGNKSDYRNVVGWSDFKQFLPKKTSATFSAITAEASLNESIDKSDLCKIIINSEYSKNNNVNVIRADNFIFHTQSVVPLTKIIFNNNVVSDKSGKTAPADAVNIKPMGLSSIESLHTVEINYLTNQDYKPKWEIDVMESNVPEALWGACSNNNSIQPTANTLPNRWVGLKVKSPPSVAGYSPGAINLQSAFGYIPVKKGLLPYGKKAVGNEIIQDENNSISIIQKTINAKQVVSRRDSVANSLMKLGLFTNQKMDPLTLFEEQIGSLFSEAPLQAKTSK